MSGPGILLFHTQRCDLRQLSLWPFRVAPSPDQTGMSVSLSSRPSPQAGDPEAPIQRTPRPRTCSWRVAKSPMPRFANWVGAGAGNSSDARSTEGSWPLNCESDLLALLDVGFDIPASALVLPRRLLRRPRTDGEVREIPILERNAHTSIRNGHCHPAAR
jgi:hypothetical protein